MTHLILRAAEVALTVLERRHARRTRVRNAENHRPAVTTRKATP